MDPVGLERLRGSTAAILGLGNIGGPVGPELGRAGFGELLLVDHGRVEDVNLSRGIFTARDLGETKVAAAQRAIAERAPYTKVTTLHGDVRVDVPEYMFAAYDIVVVALDSWSARMFVNGAVHALPGRVQAVISGGLSGRSWDVIVAAPGTGGGCMQCPHGAEIAMSDEGGGCSAIAVGDARFDPSVSFVGLQVAAQIVSAAVEVLVDGPSRLAGRMISFDHDRCRLDVLRIEPGATCDGHRRLRDDEFVRVPAADYVVGDLAVMVAGQLCLSAMPDIAVEREYASTRTCSRCGNVDPVYRALVALRNERQACTACGSGACRLTTDTVLPPSARLSEVGVAIGKSVRARVRDRWIYVIPMDNEVKDV